MCVLNDSTRFSVADLQKLHGRSQMLQHNTSKTLAQKVVQTGAPALFTCYSAERLRC